MQLVIDIPDKVYKDIQRKSLEIQIDGDTLENAVLNGTPLPKDHGVLKDADKIKASMFAYMMDKGKSHEAKYVMSIAKEIVDLQKTIIEANMPRGRKGTPLEENESGYNCENWIP
jgi:hypothetical protein